MARMSLADFEARYRLDPDPWGYATSEYERDKYEATLAACGEGPFADALELGASIGVFTQLLAPRCDRLTTVDGAPTAVAAARRRLADVPDVDVILGEIPDAVPIRCFDLIVASEILYYLTASELARTVARLESVMVSGARLVAAHWRPAGPERPLDAQQVHAVLREQPWLQSVTSGGTDDFRLDVLERL
jgi:SAM-dependent methyltransferase